LDLRKIAIGTVSYGGVDSVLNALADSVCQLEVDAIVEAKTWHQPTGFSWLPPHGVLTKLLKLKMLKHWVEEDWK
jgi:hypothetical protein